MTAFFRRWYKPTGEWKEEHVFGTRSVPAPWRQHRPGPCRHRLDRKPTNNHASVAPSGTNRVPRRRPSLWHTGESCADVIAKVFADWLITPQEPLVHAQASQPGLAWLLGRGIIHEPDDIRDNNLPSNPALRLPGGKNGLRATTI